MRLRSLILAAAALATIPATAQTAGPYKILKTVKAGGEGGFDYVTADSDSRRLYVARSGPTGSLHVYDLDTLAQVGEIPNISAHGAAIDTRYHHGFATSKGVAMFDTQTLAFIKTLDVAGSPDGFLADPATHRVYILSHAEPNVTVLDAKDGAILATLSVGGDPEQSVLDTKGHMFVDVEDKSSIAVIDTRTLKLTGTYDLSSHGGGCAGLAIDTAHDVLFAACREKKNMIIVDAGNGKILADLPIGAGSDGAVFNPATMEAFSSQGDGTLSIIKESPTRTFTVQQTVATPVRAKTLTLDTKTGNLILITAAFGPAPPPQPGQRYSRAPMLPGSFEIIVVGK